MNKDKIIASALINDKTRKIYSSKLIGRFVITILLVICAFLLGVYGSSKVLLENSDFSVSIENFSREVKSIEEGIISLSETEDFKDATVRLKCEGISDLYNISANDIPDDVNDINGCHNGENYIAYTFYLKNVGAKAIISENIFVNNVVKRVDEAIRVRVYRNGIPTTYGKLSSKGMIEEDCDEEFYSDVSVTNKYYDVGPNEVVKYTVVIWLEGNDPECEHYIQGGKVSLGMTFKVVDDIENIKDNE